MYTIIILINIIVYFRDDIQLILKIVMLNNITLLLFPSYSINLCYMNNIISGTVLPFYCFSYTLLILCYMNNIIHIVTYFRDGYFRDGYFRDGYLFPGRLLISVTVIYFRDGYLFPGRLFP